MAASQFLIAITRVDGQPVVLRPGAIGERDLIAAVVAAVRARGVGLWRTEAHVIEDVTEALRTVLHDLKSEVVPS